MLAPSPSPSDADLIHRYRAIDDYCAQREAALAEELKAHKEGLLVIKNEMLRRLNERSPDLTAKANSKTEHGTAFRVRHVDANVVDRTAFLDWCMDNWEGLGSELLVVKTTTSGFSEGRGALYEFVERNRDAQGNEEFPPGLEVKRSVTVNIRKT